MFADVPSLRRMVALRSMARPPASGGQGSTTLGKEQRKDRRFYPSKLLPQSAEGLTAGFSTWLWGATRFPVGAGIWRLRAEDSDLAVVLTVPLGSPGNILGVSVLCNPAHRLGKQKGTGPKSWTEIGRLCFA